MKRIPLVNTKQGSASVHRFSNGNTLPLMQVPFGMISFCPQTDEHLRWYYHPSHRSLMGVRITHQPSPWIGDHGAICIMPQKTKPVLDCEDRWSGYRPEEAVLQPHYMKLRFLRSRCDMELTPTMRGAALRFAFDEENDNYISFLSVKDRSFFSFDADKNILSGWTQQSCSGKPVNFRQYFVVCFDENCIDKNGTLISESEKTSLCNAVDGEDTAIHLKVNGKTANAVLAISWIGYDLATESIKRELDGKTFEEIKSAAEKLWEDRLACIDIEAKDEKQNRTFYSCMYRAFLYPHRCDEIAADGMTVHYCPADASVREGIRYTDNGFWDTFRTCYPFYSLVCPDEYAEMCRSFLRDYDECGWLPRWIAPGEVGCMPSTLVDAVLADACVKGILNQDEMRACMNAMRKHATTDAPESRYGRNGAESYCRLGYVPYDEQKESVNLTLDAAYGDFCIAQIAALLGEKELEAEYRKRALNYKNIYDKETTFMRAKHSDGTFRPDFNPFKWGLDYTEGSAWQSTFAVQHDPEGFAELFGGTEGVLKKLDELFGTPPYYIDNAYGCEIHEMTEMAAADFGQCAISNQPSFHFPYFFTLYGQPEKTAYWVERMCNDVFSYEDDGFPGDEDNGSMALWYVFSSLGLYPFCPGKAEYVKTKQLVKSAKINGKDFDPEKFGTIIAHKDVI